MPQIIEIWYKNGTHFLDKRGEQFCNFTEKNLNMKTISKTILINNSGKFRIRNADSVSQEFQTTFSLHILAY